MARLSKRRTDRPLSPEMAPDPTPVPEAGQVEFFNRDLSWLEFNRRVLSEALDDRTPILERVRFLSIFNSNLDEFFMKRVGFLRTQLSSDVITRAADGMTAVEVLASIRNMVIPMQQQQAECWKQLRPRLAEVGIHFPALGQLSDVERESARRYFLESVFPVLTPLAVDPGSPFPFISNLSTSLGVVLLHPDRQEPLFARVKVPSVLPRWVNVSLPRSGAYRFVSLEEMISENLHDLFPDMTVLHVMRFRVTRNAEIEPEDDTDYEDLREQTEEELRQRKFAEPVRLEHGPDPNQWIRHFLMDELELDDNDVYELPGELDYTPLKIIADLPIPKLRYDVWTPLTPPALADEDSDIFAIIRRGDLLVHHPYESFPASVERFLVTAAEDPKVLAIKMTLYRVGDASPFITPLVAAAETGKQVVCLVELKARFDEERNLAVAQALEKAGVHVLYGVVGLKTHCKTTLVVRQDTDAIRCYAHIGTGNYNAVTARLYTDLGLFTCDKDLTHDLVELFHYLTGRSLKREYRKLFVAPANMRDRFLALIDREIQHQKAGRPARIIAKMNQLEDRKVIRKLYDASREGVAIDLVVRGFCTLRPQLPGLSDNIRVQSVIGRFLEHSRVFYFRNGADDPINGEFYIGSGDWMYRNLTNRVEAVVPIERRPHRERLWEILSTLLTDRRSGWDLQNDGQYTQRRPQDGQVALGTHQTLMNSTRSSSLTVEEWRSLKA